MAGAAAQQQLAAVVSARVGREPGGRHGRVEHVPAHEPLAAHEPVGQARAEQQAFAVVRVSAVGVQLVVPVRPDGQEAARGHGGRDKRETADRQPDHRAAVAGPHVRYTVIPIIYSLRSTRNTVCITNTWAISLAFARVLNTRSLRNGSFSNKTVGYQARSSPRFRV